MLLLSLGTLLLFSLPANAQTCSSDPERCAYVSTSGTARRVVSVDPSTATVTTLRSYSSSAVIRDLTIAPDHRPGCASTPAQPCATKLYVAVDDRIERLNLDGSGASEVYSPKASCSVTQPTAPSGVRIDRQGDLLFNSADGVWRIAAATAGDCAQQVPGTSGSGGGLAFLHNGDLVVSSQTTVKIGSAASPIALGAPVVGVAVDANNNVIVAAGDSLYRFGPDGTADTGWTVSFAPLRPTYIEARNDPGQYLYVSVSDTAGENGALYRVSVAGETTLLATLPRVRGAVIGAYGLGLHPGRRQIEAQLGLDGAYTFDFGYSVFEITPDASSATCAASVTAIPEQAQALNDVFSDSGLAGVASIPQSGQQGFATRYQVASAPSGCLGLVNTRWAGYFDPAQYPQPGMARIPDTCSGGAPCAQLLQTFYFSPTGPLPGDPIIINRTLTSGFVPVSVPLASNFVFGGWLSPMGSNPPATVNQGQTAVFKFQLFRNGRTISDSQAASVTTVFSIAKVPFSEEASLFPGNSIQVPPSFVYDSRDDQFRYTLDTSQLSAGRYRAIVVSNSFSWEELEFCVNSCN